TQSKLDGAPAYSHFATAHLVRPDFTHQAATEVATHKPQLSDANAGCCWEVLPTEWVRACAQRAPRRPPLAMTESVQASDIQRSMERDGVSERLGRSHNEEALMFDPRDYGDPRDSESRDRGDNGRDLSRGGRGPSEARDRSPQSPRDVFM